MSGGTVATDVETDPGAPGTGRGIVGLIAGPNFGPGDTDLLDVLEAAAARGWSVRVAAPDGAVADALSVRGLGHAMVPDVEPWVPTSLATAAARRRAGRGAERLRAAIGGADAIITASLDAVAAVAALDPTSGARPKIAWLAAAPVTGRRNRALLSHVASDIDVALTAGRVAAAEASAAALRVARIGDRDSRVVPGHVLDALEALTADDHGTVSKLEPRRSVVFAVPDFEPTVGGTTRQSRNQAEALAARGGAVTIVTQRLDRSWPRLERSGAVTVRRLGPMRRDSGAMKLLVLRMAWWLHRHRASTDVVQVIMYPDFVLSAWMAGMADRTVMCWAGLGDATDVLESTGRPARALVRAGRRRVMSSVTHVALTPALRDELTALGIDKVAVVPTPVDLDAFHPPSTDERSAARRELEIADEQIAIVYTGHLRALKRVDRLIDAFALRVRAGIDARLFLVGDSRADLDDRRGALRAQVKRLGLEERVEFAGAVPDVRPYLYAADVFVLPSDREGLPNSLLEAMACGLPCIAPASAAGDQVLDATSGIVPASNDPRDLAGALEALEDPERRAQLAAGARAAAAHYSLAAVTDRYEALYDKNSRD